MRTALLLLTRLPLPGGAPAAVAGAVWAFPLAGLVVGLLGGLVWWLMRATGMPPLLAAVWTIAATICLTGALHEDGLADTADGFGGGATRERKLEIMRDSRIGAFGALALILSVSVRIAALAALREPVIGAAALVASATIGRAGMLILPLMSRPARADGLGFAVSEPRTGQTLTGLAIGVGIAVLVLPLQLGLLAALAGYAGAFAIALLAGRQIGGYTGDVLGAAEVIVECVVLTLAARA